MAEIEKDDEFKIEIDLTDIFTRKKKKLTDEEVEKIQVKREAYIESKLLERVEKEEMKKEGKTKEEIQEEIRERLIRRMRKETKEERKRLEEKEEIKEGVKGIGIESKDGIRPDKFESRKGIWAKEPPLEDSAGVCMYEEKFVDLDINPDTGEFIAAYVQGVRLNL